MKKQSTFVCMVSQQTVPVYLFLKERCLPGDEVWLISSKGQNEDNLRYLSDTLNWNNASIKKLVFKKEGDENNWISLTSQLSAWLKEDRHYIVCINGGTKMMNIALFQVLLTLPDYEYQYIPFPKNEIQILNSQQSFSPITYRMGVQEYCQLHGHTIIGNTSCIRSLRENDYIFTLFTRGFTQEVRVGLSLLRAMRGKRSDIKHDERLLSLWKQYDKDKKISIQDIPEINGLFNWFGFHPSDNNYISRTELEYLTGGWFEEWTFQQIQSHLNLAKGHIVLGVHLDSKGGNELDVAFTYNNALYVVECKSGIERLGELKSYLAKASAIRTALKGLSASSVIFGISDDTKEWHDAAEYFSLKYISREQLADPVLRFSFIK